MTGSTITVNADDLIKSLKEAQKKMANPEPIMKIWGQVIRTSVIRNFEVQGRPKKWRKLAPKTVKRRGAAGPILRRQGFAGGLMGSINVKTTASSVSVGTNKIYAATHQFGDARRNIPQRQFLMIQRPVDVNEMKAALMKYLGIKK